MRTIVLLIIALFYSTVCPAPDLRTISFDEITRLVLAEDDFTPQGRFGDLPNLQGVDRPGLIDALLRRGDTTQQMRAIMDPERFTVRRDPNIAKYLHPRGVTYLGEWRIDEDIGATGLFSVGTRVKMVVRYSSGTANSEWKEGQKRIFGKSVMLFPTQDSSAAVTPVSILTLDNYGFDATDRKLLLPSPKEGNVYFTNFAPAESLRGRVLGRLIFDAIDPPNAHRPLDHIASVDQNGKLIERPIVPFEIRFYPKDFNQTEKENFYPDHPDFRHELLNYRQGKVSTGAIGQIAFDIVAVMDAPSLGKKARVAKRIGEYRVHEGNINRFTELEMRFFHITHAQSDPDRYAASYRRFLQSYGRTTSPWGCALSLLIKRFDPTFRSNYRDIILN